MTPSPVAVPVTWPAAAQALGLPCPSQAYPQNVRCPVCDGRMTVYQDTRTGSCWHHCRACARSGDMAVLAGAVWGVDPDAAAARLALEGRTTDCVTPPSTGDRMLRLAKLWEDAHGRACLAPLPELNPVLARHRLQHAHAGVRRERGPAALYGYSDRVTVEQAFQPSYDPRNRRVRPNASVVFRGGRWDQVLAVPFFDMPGRVRAFLFVGREGGPEDRVYARARDTSPEFGLAGLPAVDGAGGSYGEAVVAVRDPLFMLRLQNKHSSVSARPLPMVAWHESHKGVTLEGWKALSGHRVVLWAFDLDAATLRQALVTDADLYLAGASAAAEDSLDELVRSRTALDHYRAAVKGARPWRQVLESWAEDRGQAALEALLLDLEATDCHGVLKKTDGRVADLLSRHLSRAVPRSVNYGNYVVTEQPDGSWTSARAHRSLKVGVVNLVCSAGLQIDEVAPGPPELCRGRVRYKGEDLPFEAVYAGVKADPFRFVDRLLIDRGKGVLSYDPRWRSRILPLAVQFHEPRVVR